MNKSQLQHLDDLRMHEINNILSIISENKKGNEDRLSILEIGAGTGLQSKIISESGYDVEAIDIESSKYSGIRVFPIKNYDGINIPFPDNFFDIVFTSSVLEHIEKLECFQSEIKRVVKNNGLSIHILPNSYWRAWTLITHYPFLVKEFSLIILNYINTKNKKSITIDRKSNKISFFEQIKKSFLPHRHGERGNAITELYYFRKAWWKNFFLKNGWNVVEIYNNNLFYTGYMLFGSLLPIKLRILMSYFFGSSCFVFVLKKI